MLRRSSNEPADKWQMTCHSHHTLHVRVQMMFMQTVNNSRGVCVAHDNSSPRDKWHPSSIDLGHNFLNNLWTELFRGAEMHKHRIKEKIHWTQSAHRKSDVSCLGKTTPTEKSQSSFNGMLMFAACLIISFISNPTNKRRRLLAKICVHPGQNSHC